MDEQEQKRLADLSMGASEAPDGGNVVISVADMRWLCEQLTATIPPKPYLNEWNQLVTPEAADNGSSNT